MAVLKRSCMIPTPFILVQPLAYLYQLLNHIWQIHISVKMQIELQVLVKFPKLSNDCSVNMFGIWVNRAQADFIPSCPCHVYFTELSLAARNTKSLSYDGDKHASLCQTLAKEEMHTDMRLYLPEQLDYFKATGRSGQTRTQR